MSSDKEFKKSDPGKTETSVFSQSPNRGERSLGRGLEDVSHLFLTKTTDEATAEEQRWAERSYPQPAARSPFVMRPCRSFTKEQLGAMLMDLRGVLEEGLRPIDAHIPCDPYGEIDLLALDRANQLTIIDFDSTSNDGLLLRGIGHFDWVVRNIPNMRRMYQGQVINFSSQPRLFLVAPQFSRVLRSIARQITRPRIDWVRYHVVEASGGSGIFFEHIESE